MTQIRNGARIRILIVDDHPMLREGIAAVVENEPDLQIVGEAATGVDAVSRFAELQPDVTLMDLQMPELDGIEALRAIRAHQPDSRVIVLTTYAGDVRALKALTLGASGYLLKNALRHELLNAIRAVHFGRRYVSPDVADDIARHSSSDTLTQRELEVLTVLAAGKSNGAVARELALSEETVKTHLKGIFAKLGVSDRTQAVTLAMRRGIISF